MSLTFNGFTALACSAALTHSQVQPRQPLDADSPAAHALSYASQRGEEVIPTLDTLDTRLSLLALLESFIRAGTSDWECGKYLLLQKAIYKCTIQLIYTLSYLHIGKYLLQAGSTLLNQVVMPNLVWRVGMFCCFRLLFAFLNFYY